MPAGLALPRAWLIGAAILLVAALAGYIVWLRHDRGAERSRAEAAIATQGRLQATVDQVVATNMANVDAWARERADRARADAAALRADEAAQAAVSRLDALKKEIRRAQPQSPVVGEHRRRVLVELRQWPGAGRGDAGRGGAPADPPGPAAVPGPP